jgi:type IV pilus assembly protein PilW
MSGDPTQPATNEIADHVHQMELRYLPFEGSEYIAAASVTNWSQVRAVRITLTLVSTDTRDVNGQLLQRRLTHTVYLRNQTES